MELAKQIEAAQSRANQLAIQESNLRDQLAPLQAQLDQVIRAKHQALGELVALTRLANEERQQTAQPTAAPSAKRKPGDR